jgi:hypothetical protein
MLSLRAGSVNPLSQECIWSPRGELAGGKKIGGKNQLVKRLLDNANVSCSNVGWSGSTGPNTGLKRSLSQGVRTNAYKRINPVFRSAYLYCAQLHIFGLGTSVVI